MLYHMTGLWGLLAIAALLWPCRVSGPIDGVPLDGTAEALLLGLAVPALWWFHPRFLETRLARGCVIALLAWKALTAAVLVQDGWCVRFVPSRPLVADGAGAPHCWDVRADWRSADPSCSTIMTRPYGHFSEFPVWFFNLPPPNESWPQPSDRPPGATIVMTVTGFIEARHAGDFQLVTGPDVSSEVRVDGGPVSSGDTSGAGVTLREGIHTVGVKATLTGDRWEFVPRWNGVDLWSGLWSGPTATRAKPSALDLMIHPWAKWVTPG